MKNITIILENRPGSLADIGETLGCANVNIEALCGIPVEGKGYLNITIKDHVRTRCILEEAGFKIVAERDVLIYDMEHISGIPGAVGEITRKLASAGINIDLIYIAEHNKIVLGVDDLDKARSIL